MSDKRLTLVTVQVGLRRPYENVVAAGIRPIANRFSMDGCVIVQGLSELLLTLHLQICLTG